MDAVNIADKNAVVQRLIREVTMYFEFMGVPMPMKIVSGKYARALKSHGGVAEVLEELRVDGTIEVVVTKKGSRLVYPRDGATRIEPGNALLKRG